MRVAEYQRGKGAISECRATILFLEERDHALIAQARELLGLERGAQCDVGEERHRGVEHGHRRVQRDRRAVEARARREVRTEEGLLFGDV